MVLKSVCSLDFREFELCLYLVNGDNGLSEKKWERILKYFGNILSVI